MNVSQEQRGLVSHSIELAFIRFNPQIFPVPENPTNNPKKQKSNYFLEIGSVIPSRGQIAARQPGMEQT